MHHTFALAPYLSISAAHFLREGLFGVRLDEDSTVLRWRVDMCGAGMRAWRGMDCMVWNVVSYVLGRSCRLCAWYDVDSGRWRC
jgi:hypothetical protein